jgi:hypothetical protein
MTLQRDPDDTRNWGARIGDVWRAAREREGIGIIVAVVVISALLIAGLSLVLEPPGHTGKPPKTPPATYRAQ